jgi:phosphocarrier protein
LLFCVFCIISEKTDKIVLNEKLWKDEKMKQFTFVIKDKNGMHARPAGMISSCAKKYSSNIRIKKDDKVADAKRLLSLMALGATCNSILDVIVDGVDEIEAYNELYATMTKVLGEG